MYVYLQAEPHLFTVGFYSPGGDWMPESDHPTAEEAAARVHYLNGGNVREPEPTYGPLQIEGGA